MSIITDQDDTTGFFDSSTDSVSFRPAKNSIDYFMVVDPSMRGDILLNNYEVVGFLSILEGNLTKHFLPKRITNFDTNIRTMVSVSGTKEYLLSILV